MTVRLTGGVLAGRRLAGPARVGKGLPRERRSASGRRGARPGAFPGAFPAASVPGAIGAGQRPSAARLRKSLFEVLGAEVAGSSVLDVCAGAGTLGFEALSRGAAHCVFVERSRPMARLIANNAQRLGVDAFRLIGGDALVSLGRLADAGARFGVVFCDPPWQDWEAGAGERLIATAFRLDPGLVVAEHPAAFQPAARIPGARSGEPAPPPAFRPGLVRIRTRIVGRGAYSLYRQRAEPPEPSTSRF